MDGNASIRSPLLLVSHSSQSVRDIGEKSHHDRALLTSTSKGEGLTRESFIADLTPLSAQPLERGLVISVTTDASILNE